MLKYKELQTTIATITEGKVIELFCMTDDFCKFFDARRQNRHLFPPQNANIVTLQPC